MRWTLVLLLASCIPALAGDLQDLKRACKRGADAPAPGIHWTEQCVEDIFTLQPVHPAIHTIAPGTGPAFGGALGIVSREDRTEWLPSALLVRSTDGSTLAQVGLTIAVPPFSLVKIKEADTEVVNKDEKGYHDTRSAALPAKTDANGNREILQRGTTRIALVRDYWEIDSKMSMSFDGQWMDLRRQAFYGLGPLTSQSGLAFYGLRQTSARFKINDPITKWAEIGFEAEFLRPEVRSVPNASRPSIEQAYNAATAPGLTGHIDFMRYEPYIRFRLPVHNYHFRTTEFKVGYGFYHDLESSQFSFQRLSSTVRSEHDLRLPTHHTASHRSGWANFLCPKLRGEHCTAGTVSLTGVVSASYTGANSTVPFYLDQTLGGGDIYGNDTLRGYVDYRFVGPSRMFFQAEYRHRIWGPLGFLSFADTGRVALKPSDLAFEHMRHDIGLGMYISATSRIVLRAYVAFGTREGIRPNAKLPASF